MDDLVNKRTVIKTKLTKFRTWLDNEENHENYHPIKLRYEKIKNIIDDFEVVQTEIELTSGTTTTEFEQFENEYFEVLARAQEIIDKVRRPPAEAPSAAASNLTAHQLHTPLYNNPWIPQFELPKFDGTYNKWLSFRAQFMSMVHSSESLNDMQKLHCLKSALTGNAERIISSLECNNENFPIAWKLVTGRYDNKRLLIQNLIKNLMELTPVNKDSHSELRVFLDTIRDHMSSLKGLGQPTESWDSLLLYTFTSKIDKYAQRDWERSVKGTEMPSLDKFLDFIEEKCQILELTSKNSSEHKGKHKSLLSSQGNAKNCIICSEEHKTFTCAKFQSMSVKERSDAVKSAKACFNCLQRGHGIRECKGSNCKKCQGKHNTLLHRDKDARKEESHTENHNNQTVDSGVNRTADGDKSAGSKVLNTQL